MTTADAKKPKAKGPTAAEKLKTKIQDLEVRLSESTTKIAELDALLANSKGGGEEDSVDTIEKNEALLRVVVWQQAAGLLQSDGKTEKAAVCQTMATNIFRSSTTPNERRSVGQHFASITQASLAELKALSVVDDGDEEDEEDEENAKVKKVAAKAIKQALKQRQKNEDLKGDTKASADRKRRKSPVSDDEDVDEEQVEDDDDDDDEDEQHENKRTKLTEESSSDESD